MTDRLTWLRVATVVGFLALVGAHWRSATGFTSLIRFGHEFDDRRLPALASLPLAVVPGAGYDGQYYAQLAVEPDVTSPVLHRALDSTAYRARRILLPLLAHGLGFGRPGAILQVYALLNVLAWLVLAWCWWRWLPQHNGRAFAAWLLCLLSLGALDSVRFSLTDLPMTLALVLAVRAASTGRPRLAAFAFLGGGFIRESAVLAAPALLPSSPAGPRDRLRAAAVLALCVAPVFLWSALLLRLVPGAGLNLHGNLAWPGAALVRHVVRCAQTLAAGSFDSRALFGLIGAAGLVQQSLYLLCRWRDPDPWLRLGLPFAVLFWFLGDFVWHGYWAVARSVLPMTFAFNRAVFAQRRGVAHLVAGNFFALHGVYRFLPF